MVCPPLGAVPCRGTCAIAFAPYPSFFCSWLFRNSSWVHFVFISFGSEFVPTAHAHSYYSVQFRRSVVSDSLRPHESQHARPPCPSPTPGVYSNSCPIQFLCILLFKERCSHVQALHQGNKGFQVPAQACLSNTL